MADNLKAASLAAQLSPAEQKKIDDFNKALQVHKELSSMPQDAAQQAYKKLTPAQQTNLVQNFGNEDPTVKPKRGWLGTAWHYTGGAVASGLGYAGSHLLAGLGNVSDFMTRAYRTGAIAADQGVDLGTAWTIANDKGDKVFSPNRIIDAKAKFGNDAVDVAMRIASGEDPAVIFKSATPEQQKYIMLADPTNTVIPGFNSPEEIKAARNLFQDTQDAVQAAKYSPGRQIANLVTPASLEGSGLFYKPISGAVDAAYRVLADPLLIAGKAKRLIDVSKYALDVVVGGGKVNEYFAKPAAIDFWNQYGAKLKDFTKAQADDKLDQVIRLRKDLGTLAPQFGDEIVKAFQNAAVPVQDAKTAQAFFENTKQTLEIFNGSVGRQRVILPVMDASRKLRVAALTTGRKVFNIDAVGPKLVDDYFFGGAATTDGISKMMIDGKDQIVNLVKANQNFKGIARFSTAYIQNKIDKIKALGTAIPMFENEVFDLLSTDAPQKIFQLARIGGLPQRESRLLSAAFENTKDVGTKMNIYKGLWGTISDIRGVNATAPGQDFARYLLGKTSARFGLDDAHTEIGSMPSDFSNLVAAPGVKDLDRLAARNTLYQKMFGWANSDLANKMIGAWSFLTLAGPRYALRNAGEDLMVNLAIGKSPWGITKQYQLNTRVNTFLQAAKAAEGGHNWSNNPLGAMLRFANRKEVNGIKNELTTIKNNFDTGKQKIEVLKRELSALPSGHPDIPVKRAELESIIDMYKGGMQKQVQEVFANTLTAGKLNRWREQFGLQPMNKKEAEILKEHVRYGNLEQASAEVSEGGMNMFTGNDFVSRAQNLYRKTGVQTHALTVTPSDKVFVKKPGERAFTPQALHQQDEASMYSWMMQISRYANDELGGIAIANLDNRRVAIKKMTDWITDTPAGKKFYSDSRLSDTMSADQIANTNFDRAKLLFSKRNKDINYDLLNKVRVKNKAGEWEVSGQIGIGDLPKNPDDIPAVIIGPTLVPAVEAERMTSSIVQNGWTFLGLSNARMSRQPIVLNEIVSIRKQFKKTGFEDKWIENYQRGIDPKDTAKMLVAKENALKDLTNAVEERAIHQTLAYVDNPLVRTQLAWNLRNFSRFYRATEDFYRRMYKVVKYNPEALVRGSLTYEGIIHSGWIQQDDQGQSYFVYPGISTTYNAVQNVLNRLGIGNQFKIPFPVEFGSALKMITPSMNPDSLFPTFSGPVAALPMTAVTQLISGLGAPGVADNIKGYAMGKYAVDQPIISAFLPAHINRLYAAMNMDERNSQYASAYRKAVTYLEASGHGLPKKYDKDGNLIPPTTQELEAYRLAIKHTTMGILGMRFVFGFLAPASPQVMLKSDMAQWVSDNGRANFKQAFNKLLDQYPGDYNAAFAKWVELFPNQIPFTITESERKSFAPLRYSEEAGNFVTQNKDLFTNYPKAAAFLIPHKTGFSWDTYKLLKDDGLIQNKRVEDYLREVQTAADLQEYYARKDQYEADLSRAFSSFEKTRVRQQFDDWKSVFLAGRPLVQEELSQGSQKAIDRMQTFNELGFMLNQNLGIRPKTESVLRQMYDTYSNYQKQKDQLDQFGGSADMALQLKSSTIAKLRELSNYNENAKSAYDVLFSRLPGIAG